MGQRAAGANRRAATQRDPRRSDQSLTLDIESIDEAAKIVRGREFVDA